ncbi:MAG: hypothetical protein JSR76_03195 [Verrucomicrobia bacterium]|nr:hypothetical protein [Verrucomicrobiota bacterium]
MERLFPYVESLIATEPGLELARGHLAIVDLSDTQATFALEGLNQEETRNLIGRIREVCHTRLTQELIVPQIIPDGPTIRHRVMQFKVDADRLVAQFVELGEHNSFDVAMQAIAALYPAVARPVLA